MEQRGGDAAEASNTAGSGVDGLGAADSNTAGSGVDGLETASMAGATLMGGTLYWWQR